MTRTQQPAGGPGICVYARVRTSTTDPIPYRVLPIEASDAGGRLGRRLRTLLRGAITVTLLGALALGGLL